MRAPIHAPRFRFRVNHRHVARNRNSQRFHAAKHRLQFASAVAMPAAHDGRIAEMKQPRAVEPRIRHIARAESVVLFSRRATIMPSARVGQKFPKLEGRALSRLPLRGTVTTERDPPTRSASIF